MKQIAWRQKAVFILTLFIVAAILFGTDSSLAANEKRSNQKADGSFIRGVVHYVHDGDTITIKKSRGEYIKIRFYGVDCPETEKKDAWQAQPYGEAAKTFVRRMILKKQVTVRLSGDTTYDRLVGEVFYNGRSLSYELVKAGLAWWNKKFAPHDSDLKRLQKKARQKRVGLWKDARPVPPWVYRYKAQRKNQHQN